MDQIVQVPPTMAKIIPEFSGDSRQLPLFIKKCEYIINTFQGGEVQNEYLFHVLTSRLTGEAANLVGERDNIRTWLELKTLLAQHFGDPRTEDCLVLELESMKLNYNESYLDFCHRIQNLRSVLIAKIIETVDDVNLRQAKQHIYTNSSLNVFLYNLPPYLVRLVRLRNVTTLEDALKVVLEEQNFQTVYESRNNRNKSSSKPPGKSSNNNGNFQRSPNPQNQPSTPIQNRSTGNITQTNSPNNSIQYRNSFRNQNNAQNQPPQQSRSTPWLNQQAAPRTSPVYNATPANSGSNTDVTMRTASSRRVNYTNNDSLMTYDNNEQNTCDYEPQANPSYETEQIENFHLRASYREKK